MGLARDFPEPPLAGRARSQAHRAGRLPAADRREGVYLVGATELAVEHAVWDSLCIAWGTGSSCRANIGRSCRGFRNCRWPSTRRSRPDYIARRIRYGFGVWDYNAAPYAEWRMQSGHPHRAENGPRLRRLHPRPQGPVRPASRVLRPGWRKSRDIRGEAKLCIGNPEPVVAGGRICRRPVRPRAGGRQHLDRTRSDGGGWCECERQKSWGASPTAIAPGQRGGRRGEPEVSRQAGLYAYNFHSSPPGIRAHGQVVVSVATAFLKGGLSLDEHPRRLVRARLRPWEFANTTV